MQICYRSAGVLMPPCPHPWLRPRVPQEHANRWFIGGGSYAPPSNPPPLRHASGYLENVPMDDRSVGAPLSPPLATPLCTLRTCQWMIGRRGFSIISVQCFFSNFFLDFTQHVLEKKNNKGAGVLGRWQGPSEVPHSMFRFNLCVRKLDFSLVIF